MADQKNQPKEEKKEEQKPPEKPQVIITLEVDYVGSDGKYTIHISVGSPNTPSFKPDQYCKVLVMEGRGKATPLSLDKFGHCQHAVTDFSERSKIVTVRVLDTFGNKQVDKSITLRGPKKKPSPC